MHIISESDWISCVGPAAGDIEVTFDMSMGLFGHFKHQRRIATRYDKTALSFASFLSRTWAG